MGRRTEKLVESCKSFLAVKDEWSKTDNNRPEPDEDFWDGVDALFESFATGTIPAECRKMAKIVEDIQEEVGIFDSREDTAQLNPGNKFWRCVEELEKHLRNTVDAPPLKPLESIKELCALPRMTHNQVARMWGFTDRHGNPMPWLVQKELDNPGCIIETPKSIDGRSWVDPRIAERERDEMADVDGPSGEDLDSDGPDDADDEGDDGEKHHARPKVRRTKEAEKQSPESCHDLWEQGVGYVQTAKMLKRSEGEVKKEFDAFEKERQDSIVAAK